MTILVYMFDFDSCVMNLFLHKPQILNCSYYRISSKHIVMLSITAKNNTRNNFKYGLEQKLYNIYIKFVIEISLE